MMVAATKFHAMYSFKLRYVLGANHLSKIFVVRGRWSDYFLNETNGAVVQFCVKLVSTALRLYPSGCSFNGSPCFILTGR